jgi:hypothetical protein
MTTYKVLYRKNFPSPFSPAPVCVSFDDYKFIAYVEAENLEDLFRRMNVVDGSAFEMPRTIGCRSMSTGDVAIADSGEAHYCASAGWESVEVNQ